MRFANLILFFSTGFKPLSEKDYFMARLLAFFQLLRPFNCLMATFAVYIGYAVSVHALQFNQQIGFAMIAAFLVCGAGQAINDYFDAHIDKKKNPKKPIPSGTISARNALLFSLLLFACGNIFAFFVNQTALAISIAFTLLLAAYSAFLGKAKWLGNWVVAAGTAFTLIFGAAVSGNYKIVWLLAASALLSNVVREIIKDNEDKLADKGYKKSLAMLLSHSQMITLVFVLSITAFALSIMPLVLGLFGNAVFAILVLLANVLFFYAIFCFAKKDFHLAQQLSKAGMLFALIGFLAGVL